MLTSGIINRAIEECKQSTFRVHLGAVVFKGKRIISSGHNGIRSSSINNRYKEWLNALHAEQAALMGLDWTRLSGYSLLVLRVSKTMEVLGNAKPCSMCQGLIKTIGLKDVYYSDHHGQIVKLDWSKI